MPSHFRYFPVVSYQTSPEGRRTLLTNIMRRIVLHKMVQSRDVLFDQYTVRDGERPDIVAHKYYDDPTLDWLVLYSNQMLHPQFDWYMGYHDFKAYLAGKYGSVEEAHRQIHHYEKRFLERRKLPNGEYTEELWLIVDRTTYFQTPANQRKAITAYQYENELNRSRQNIKLIHRSFVGRILKEIETLLQNA